MRYQKNYRSRKRRGGGRFGGVQVYACNRYMGDGKMYLCRANHFKPEQSKAVVEALGREAKQQERKKTNGRKLISVLKKCMDMTQLDAAILRELVEPIEGVRHLHKREQAEAGENPGN